MGFKVQQLRVVTVFNSFIEVRDFFEWEMTNRTFFKNIKAN